jgi:hypothetical protein
MCGVIPRQTFWTRSEDRIPQLDTPCLYVLPGALSASDMHDTAHTDYELTAMLWLVDLETYRQGWFTKGYCWRDMLSLGKTGILHRADHGSLYNDVLFINPKRIFMAQNSLRTLCWCSAVPA